MKRSLIWKHPKPIFSIASSREYPAEDDEEEEEDDDDEEEEEEEEEGMEGGVLVEETGGEGGELERDSSMSESWEKPPSAIVAGGRSARWPKGGLGMLWAGVWQGRAEERSGHTRVEKPYRP